MDDVIFVRNGMYGGISLRTTTLQQCRRAQANAPAGKTGRKVDTSTPISPPLLHRIVPVLGLPYVRVSPDTSSFWPLSGRPVGFSKIGGLSGFLTQSASRPTFERCQLQRRIYDGMRQRNHRMRVGISKLQGRLNVVTLNDILFVFVNKQIPLRSHVINCSGRSSEVSSTLYLTDNDPV